MGTDAAALWQNATVLIRNEKDQLGTGFILFDVLEPGPPTSQVRAVVVTNKHVIAREGADRRSTKQIHLSFVLGNLDGSFLPIEKDYPMQYEDGQPLWREHPQSEVDVLAIDISPILNSVPGWGSTLVAPNLLCSAADWSSRDIRAGQNVLVVGYPVGIREAATNRPMVRHGIISSDPQSPFRVVGRSSGSDQERTIRGFLVDCQGLHGSPVKAHRAP
jgi:hypothetical protein